MVTARRYKLSAQTIHHRLRKNNNPIRVLDIPSCGVPTTTWFCSVTNPNLPLVILMALLKDYCCTNERYAGCCELERDRFGGGSLMVWGGIMGGQKTGLVVMQGSLNNSCYINDSLRPHVIPFLQVTSHFIPFWSFRILLYFQFGHFVPTFTIFQKTVLVI